MAVQRYHKSPDGVEHPEAYFKVAQVNLDVIRKTGQVTVLGYHDASTKDTQPVGGAELGFTVSLEEYNTYFAPVAIDPEGENQVKAAYKFVKGPKNVLKEGYSYDELSGTYKDANDNTVSSDVALTYRFTGEDV